MFSNKIFSKFIRVEISYDSAMVTFKVEIPYASDLGRPEFSPISDYSSSILENDEF